MRKLLLETGRKIICITQWQKTWLNCVLQLCEKQTCDEFEYLAEEISKENVEGGTWCTVKCERKEKLRKELLCKKKPKFDYLGEFSAYPNCKGC